jgi:hypothetical protein
MRKYLRFFLIAVSFIDFASAHAQVEASYLTTKGYSSWGAGFFLNTGFPVNRRNMITWEGAFELYRQAVLVPLPLLGYRHSLGIFGHGLYIEPQLGYMFIAGSPTESSKSLPDGAISALNRPASSGWITALVVGRQFEGRLALNLGVRYEQIFIPGTESVHVLALRLTHTIVCGRRRYY